MSGTALTALRDELELGSRVSFLGACRRHAVAARRVRCALPPVARRRPARRGGRGTGQRRPGGGERGRGHPGTRSATARRASSSASRTSAGLADSILGLLASPELAAAAGAACGSAKSARTLRPATRPGAHGGAPGGRGRAPRSRLCTSVEGRTRPAPAPVEVLFLINALRIGGEETELRILARHFDRSHGFVSTSISLHPYNDPATLVAPARRRPDDRYPVPRIGRRRQGRLRARSHRPPPRPRGGRLPGPAPGLPCRRGPAPERVQPGGARRCRGRSVAPSRRIARPATSPCRRQSGRRPRRAWPNRRTPSTCPAWSTPNATPASTGRRFVEGSGFAEDACIVTFVGRLNPKKRVEDLIEAGRLPLAALSAAACADRQRPGRLPAGIRRPVCSDRYAQLPASQVTFTGPRTDIPEILTASDIFVLPSIGEGMSHVISEAGAAGVAVVAVDDGAARLQLRRRGGRAPGAGRAAGHSWRSASASWSITPTRGGGSVAVCAPGWSGSSAPGGSCRRGRRCWPTRPRPACPRTNCKSRRSMPGWNFQPRSRSRRSPPATPRA